MRGRATRLSATGNNGALRRYWGAIRVLSSAISAAYAAATGPTASDKAPLVASMDQAA